MRKPNNEQLEALAKVARSREFEIVREWLEQCQIDVQQRLERETNTAAVHQIQGEAQTLRFILDQAQEAPENLRKVQT